MDTVCKEEDEKSGMDMDTTHVKTEGHEHTVRFRYQYKKYTVSCNAPGTVLHRLQTDTSFKGICEQKKQKRRTTELVIQREQMPRGAITPHFPCCLLSDNELLDIKFIKSDGKSRTAKKQQLAVSSPKSSVCFYIKTKGERNISLVMNNNKFRDIADYVCVYAEKGETVKKALKRDGRFRSVIFKKGALKEQSTEDNMNLSNLVDHMDGKQYQITVSPHQTGSQESSQEMSQETETVKDERSEVPETSQDKKPIQDSIQTQKKERETPAEEKTTRKYPIDIKMIPDSDKILELLRAQHKDLLKTLKEREKLKDDTEVKKFFRQEYDKSSQSFSEIKRLKRLVEMSESVCQIRSDASPVGTGFVLFDRFVLTNAHVANIILRPRPACRPTAAFAYEDCNTGFEIPVKETCVAEYFGKDDMGNYMDFALLELEMKNVCPELLKCYAPPPIRGGVCIIGHPEGGVKRMDPSFIIPNDDIPQAAWRYYESNQSSAVFHVVTHECLAEDMDIRRSHIAYHSCFFHGSSGSPVFDDHCNLIGVHTGGYCYNGESNKTRSVMEYAFPMKPILMQIFIQCTISGRSDVVQQLEAQNNISYVLEEAKKPL